MMNANEVIKEWPSKPKEIAQKMIGKYGDPDEVTMSRLIWFNNGIWKRTILYRDEVPHNFPKPHTDLLEQVINYKVPTSKFDELARFDGSVIVERTKGEIAARCDEEEMNMLAINLSNDIIMNDKTVEEARREYAQNVIAFMMGKPMSYTQKLQFEVQKDQTNDTDETIIDNQMKEEVMKKMEKM